MSEHALLSASGAHRWMACTPSARLELELDDTSSYAAEEGTAAHALAEYKLRKAFRQRSKKPASKYDCKEMELYTDDYVAFVMELMAQAKHTNTTPVTLIEQRLDFSRYVKDGFGTGDFVLVTDGLLHIVDFKYGLGVLVEAEDNPQMKLYALGALELFDGIYDIDTVSMTIFQPRRENISTCTIPTGTLYRWAEDILKPKAALAYEGGGEYVPGEHCRFCRAALRCRARAAAKMDLAAFEFTPYPLLSDEEMAEILTAISDLTHWANEISNYATEAAVSHGKQWPGFKLVEGRSNRRYSDEKAVAKTAKAAGYQNIFRRSLIPISDMERLMGKAKFAEILGGLVIKPPGAATLVPITDKRPPLPISNAKTDFMEEQKP